MRVKFALSGALLLLLGSYAIAQEQVLAVCSGDHRSRWKSRPL